MSTNKVINIMHVAIQTSNIDQAISFYTKILGAELILPPTKFKRRYVAWLKVGSTKIELFSKRNSEVLDKWSDYYSGPIHIAFGVDNIDSFLEEAHSKGAKFHPSHPEPFIPPVKNAKKIAYLLGPDGEEVEIRSVNDE